MAKIDLGQSALDYLAIDSKDLDDVEALAEDRGGYWAACWAFFLSLQDKSARELTFKQTNWAIDVKDKLDELRRRGKI